MLKKLFNNKKFIFIFVFAVEMIFYYLFEHCLIGGKFIFADLGLGPTFGLMFGPAGALGYAFALFTGEIIDGIDIMAALIDFAILFFISVLTYKVWYSSFNRKKIDTPRFDSTYNIIKFVSIIVIVSIVYMALIRISLEAYSNFRYLYSTTLSIDLIAYILNYIAFSIILGLLVLSIFNICKIPLQTPKKRISKINIKSKYFIVPLFVLIAYLIIKHFTIDSDILDNLFFMGAIITSIVYYLNSFDVEVKPTNNNYSIIEQVIVVFLFMFSITIAFNYRYIYILADAAFGGITHDFQLLIIITFSCFFVILLSLIHIHYIEKNVTNPLYELIATSQNYFKSKNREKSLSKLEKYAKKDDSIGVLVKSFINLYNNIKTNLSKLKIATSEKERLETEFSVASRIQSNMLKKDFEEFSHHEPFDIYAYMKPAREVGGDFYDYFRIGDDVYFVIGDVSGKGIPATLFMVKTMHLIRNHCKFHDSLSEVMENVNDLACERNEEELFTTAWIGKVNLKSGKLSFVNAGHNPPLVRHGGDDFKYLKTRPNLVLGGIAGIAYKEHEIALDVGDCIFLYTDGVTESNENYHGFYGEERLRDTLNKNRNEGVNVIIGKITEDIDDFCKSSEQFDDTTMLILKWEGVQ